jgi:hypothetical protein
LRALATALSIVIPTATLAISNMATLQLLEVESILLFRSQGMVLMFLKEMIINCGVEDI